MVHWLEVRDAIYNEIHTEFWDPNQEAFVQSKEATARRFLPVMRWCGLSARPIPAGSASSKLQLAVLRLGLLCDGNIRVGAFPRHLS